MTWGFFTCRYCSLSFWYGKRSKLYRRSGWPGIQRDDADRRLFTVIAVAAQTDVHPVACAVIGALLGFLCFNTYPAKVFMGDTGSLALGGFVVSTAYMLQIPFFLPIVAFIYFVEVLSVIIQVTYYKKTKKRIFKMAPIHHHFELSGWPETKVVSIFSIVTAVLCLIECLLISAEELLC